MCHCVIYVSYICHIYLNDQAIKDLLSDFGQIVLGNVAPGLVQAQLGDTDVRRNWAMAAMVPLFLFDPVAIGIYLFDNLSAKPLGNQWHPKEVRTSLEYRV